MAYLSEVERVPIDSIWPGHILDRAFNMWFGFEKVGKSIVLDDVIARGALGLPMPPFDPDDPDAPRLPPFQSVLIELEDEPSVSADRVEAAARHYAGDEGAERALKAVFEMSLPERDEPGEGELAMKWAMPDDLSLLVRKIREMNRHDRAKSRVARDGALGPVRLVVINPVKSASTVSVSYSEQVVRRKLVAPLNAVIQATGVAIVGVGHFYRGATPENWKDKVDLSKAWMKASRLTNVIFPDPDDPEIAVLKPGASNYGTPPNAEVRYRIHAERYADPNAHVVWVPPKLPKGADSSREDAVLLSELIEVGVPVDYRMLAAWLSWDAERALRSAIRLREQGMVVFYDGMVAVAPPAAAEIEPPVLSIAEGIDLTPRFTPREPALVGDYPA